MSSKTKKPEKHKKEVLTLADNPSLIKAGEDIRLRVFDDFFIEKELPKWKEYNDRFESICKILSLKYKDDLEIKSAIERLKDPEEQKKLDAERLALKKMKKSLDDDSWDIQGKHEKSVKESILKTARLIVEYKPSILDKFLNKIGIHKNKPLVPVDIAFADLKTKIITTSTEEMDAASQSVDRIVKRLTDSGQYKLAKKVKAYSEDIAAQYSLVKAGFTSFIEESTLIDFVKKSERGVRIDFMRYYEGNIPDEVLEKKKAADALKVFDNYVIAFYDDSISNRSSAEKKIEKENKEKVKEEADKAVAVRRDPILFGIIKDVRRLFFIADWVTPDDDLTLENVEKLLGIKRNDIKDDTIYGNSISSDMITQGVNTISNNGVIPRSSIASYDYDEYFDLNSSNSRGIVYRTTRT